MKLQTIRRIFALVLILGVLLFVTGGTYEVTWLLIVGLCLLAGDLIFFLVMHRCPDCRGYLRGGEKHCPHCGVKLEK